MLILPIWEKQSIWSVEDYDAERYYVTFGLWHEPSVCRLSVVCCM